MQNAVFDARLLPHFDVQLRHAWVAQGVFSAVPELFGDQQIKLSGVIIPPNLVPMRYIITANQEPLLFQSTGLFDETIHNALLPSQPFGTNFEALLEDVTLNENTTPIEISARTENKSHEAHWHQRVWLMPSWGTLPSAQQMQRVGLSNANLMSALMLGGSFHRKLAKLMEIYANKSLYSCEQILDWGCGYGRLIRFFPPEHRHRVVGADIDPINIAWAKENMSDLRFEHLATTLPTKFDTAQFDLVYGNSVFTHMAEQDQFDWLSELQRITKPGGIIAVTVHGHIAWSFLGWHNSDGIAPLLTKGFRESGIANPDLVDVVGDFYTDVHHTHDYILQHWTKYFDVLDILEGFSGRQAMVVMRRRAD